MNQTLDWMLYYHLISQSILSNLLKSLRKEMLLWSHCVDQDTGLEM